MFISILKTTWCLKGYDNGEMALIPYPNTSVTSRLDDLVGAVVSRLAWWSTVRLLMTIADNRSHMVVHQTIVLLHWTKKKAKYTHLRNGILRDHLGRTCGGLEEVTRRFFNEVNTTRSEAVSMTGMNTAIGCG